MHLDQSFIQRRIEQSSGVISALAAQSTVILDLIDRIRDCLAAGGTIYTCGNGGSAAEALHLAEELIGRYRAERPPLPAVCLNADPTALTCIANDFGFDEVFARQVEALVGPDDAVVVFSTSGNSENIARALSRGRAKGAAMVGLLGKGGGGCAPLCDVALVVQSDATEHIQEAHQVIVHLILEAVEGAPRRAHVRDEAAHTA